MLLKEKILLGFGFLFFLLAHFVYIAHLFDPTLFYGVFLPWMKVLLMAAEALVPSSMDTLGLSDVLFQYVWFLPEFFILISAVILLSLALWGKLLNISTLDITQMARVFTISVLLAAAVMRGFLLFYVMQVTAGRFTYATVLFNGLLQVNVFLLVVKIALIFLCFLVLGVRSALEVKQGRSYEYFLFVLLGLFSTLVFVSAKNMLVFFLAMELQNLCWITLLGRGKGILGTESAMKYFFVSAVAGCFFIIGSYFFFLMFNTFSIDSWSVGYRVLEGDVQQLYLSKKLIIMVLKGWNFLTLEALGTGLTPLVPAELSVYLTVAVLFLLFPILIKLGVFPFSYWISEVYSGASFCTLGLLTYVSKTAYLVVILRLFCYFGQLNFDALWVPVILYVAVGSLLFTAIMTFLTQRIRAFLGLSGVVHLGFVFLGRFSWSAGSDFAYPNYGIGVFYYLVYVLSSFVFFAFLCYADEARLKRGLPGLDYLVDLKGLLNTQRPLALGLLFICFVWVGIPPFLGFWSKFFVLLNVIQVPVLFVVALISHVISRIYYLRVVQLVAFDEPEQRSSLRIPGVDWHFSSFFVLIFVFLLFFGMLFLFKYRTTVLYLPNSMIVAGLVKFML